MKNTPQAANNAEPLQLIGQAITDDLRRFIAEEIAVALDRRPSETLDRRTVAGLLKISLPTLLRRTADGSIPCTRIGRRVLFERAQIDALLQSKAVQAWEQKKCPLRENVAGKYLLKAGGLFDYKYTEIFGVMRKVILYFGG